MNRTKIFSLVLFLGIFNYAQNNSIEEAKIDELFKSLNDTSRPGAAAALIKDGEIIYLKGFGNANLETKVIITPKTKFQLGELSKQFTSLAILLLEQEGKILLDDNIRKYLPELPSYDYRITISHLLNHTSGLYDINRVNNMIRGTMNIETQAEAIKLIASQKTLAFKPGTEFSFHEAVTESVLMAEIVARSSGVSFAQYVKTNIFEPLGMTNSLIQDDSNAIIENVAEPYQRTGETANYKKNEVESSVIGAINAYCSAEDLAKWYANFHHSKNNLGKLIQKLNDPVRLNNGDTFVYYWGEMAIGREFSHPERGLPIFWNFGFQGAYGTNVFRYLDQKIISIVLGNNNQYNGALAQNMINLYVEDMYPLPANIDFTKKNIKKLSTEKLKEFEGHYWFKKGYASELFVENDTLRTKWLFNNRDRHQVLVPLSENKFQQYAKMEDRRFFEFKKEGNTMMLYFVFNESKPDIMERYKPVNPIENELQAYQGTYYNEEYATLFTFKINEGKLFAINLNHQDIDLRPVKKHVFTSRSLFFNALNFIEDSSGNITGFRMVTDGIRNLKFKKLISP